MAINVVERGEQIVVYSPYGHKALVLDGDRCIECEACVSACPTQALFVNDWSVEVGGSVYESGSLAIDSDYCTVGTCGEPCALMCPVDAITIEGEEEPEPPPEDPCDLFPQECQDFNRGIQVSNWLNNECRVLSPKSIHDLLQSEAAEWSMTVLGYLEGKMSLISQSAGDYRHLGAAARYAGWVGIGYNMYSAVVAVSDGTLTANEALGLASSTLGAIALIPGVGTAVGVGGLAILASGSLIIGLISNSDVGDDTVIAEFNFYDKCNN